MADNDNNLVLTVSTDMTAAQRGIRKFVGDIASGSSQIEKQFDKMGRSIDNSVTSALQTRINAMTGLGVKSAKEWTGALAEQGKELERLRARYSPLFATITNYKTAVSDIRRAHALGAISATEMTAAISKERQAALASTAAIKGRNAALSDTPVVRSGGANPYTSNIAAQFQDIGVSAAGGMSPLQIALQQGTQLSAVFNDLQRDGKGLGSALSSAFLSVISPMSLVTIGVVAASAAAIQYFSTIDWGGAKSEETLKKEAELIDAVAQKWGEALPALKAYNDERNKIAEGKDISAAAGVAADQQWEDLRKQVDDVNIALTDTASQLQQLGKDEGQIGDLQRDFNLLKNAIAAGTANSEMARKVQEDLKNLIKDGSTPAIDDFIKSIDLLAPALDKASGGAAKFKTQADELIKSIKVLDSLSRGASGSDGVQDYRLKEYLKRQADNANPTVLNPQGEPVSVPVPGRKPVQLGEPLDKAIKQEETAAQKAANAYRDLIKSADDRLGQMQQEIDLLGQFGIEADAARFALDLLQKSEDKGRSLSEAQRAEIDKKVQAYKQLASALATANLQQDLANQASLAGLSARDQKIVTMQRQYGLPEDASSATGKMIGQSVDQQEIADATKAFLSTFSNGLITEGKSLGEAFGDAVKAAAANAMQKSLDSLFGQIANAIGSAFTGGNGTTGGLSVLASAAASVGGTAAASGASLSTYAKAIQAIESGGNYSALGPVTKTGDRAYGAYQVMGANIPSWSQEALGKSMSASQFLADPSAQDAIFNNKFGGYASKYGASGAAQAWFGGPGSVGSGGGAKDILGTSGSAYVNKFNSQIAKMGETASSATSGLGQLSSGLSSVAGGLGGAAGGFNWSSLFSSSFTPTTTYGAFLGLANGGSVRGPGSATSDSIPTMLSNGEYVVNALQTKKHRRLIEAINNGTVGRMADGGLVSPRTVSVPTAPRLSARGGRGNGDVSNPGVMMINISGASGDDHVRMLARQGTQEGIAAYNENQRRGGFGTLQTRYVAQKG